MKKIMYGAMILLVVVFVFLLQIGFDISSNEAFEFISKVMYSKVMYSVIFLLGAGFLIESYRYKEYGYLYLFMIIIYLSSYLIVSIYLSTLQSSTDLSSLSRYATILKSFNDIMLYCDYVLEALLVVSIVVELDIKTPLRFGIYISSILYIFFDKIFGEPTIDDPKKAGFKLLVLFAVFAFTTITLFINKLQHMDDDVDLEFEEEPVSNEQDTIENNSNQSISSQTSLNQPPVSQLNQNTLNPTSTSSTATSPNKNFTVKNDLPNKTATNTQAPMSMGTNPLNSAPPMTTPNTQPIGATTVQNNMGNNK